MPGEGAERTTLEPRFVDVAMTPDGQRVGADRPREAARASRRPGADDAMHGRLVERGVI